MTARGGTVAAASFRARSNPLSDPRTMSTSTMSGLLSFARRRASALDEAPPTTVTHPLSRILRAARRKSWLSSTTRLRKLIALPCHAGRLGHTPLAARICEQRGDNAPGRFTEHQLHGASVESEH